MILKDLLNNPIYSKSVLLTEDIGLQRHVESINIMDAPDIIHYVKPGQLLLSNGYFMKNEPSLMLELIQQMNALGCSGLAVKTKRFKLEIPDTVLKEAEILSFPIIELSYINHSLGEILELSTSLLLENKNHELQYAIMIHKHFSSIAMQGMGFTPIIDTLSNTLAAPVLLISSRLQILKESPHFMNQQLRLLLPCILSPLEALPKTEDPIFLGLIHSFDTPYRYIIVVPIHTYRNEGYIIHLSSECDSNNLSMIAVEQATRVIGTEFSKNQAVKERSRRYKNEFFADLFDGFISEQEALHRGKKYGFDPSRNMILCIAKEDELSKYVKKSYNAYDETLLSLRDTQYEHIKRRLSFIGIPFTMFTKSDQFIILFFIEEQRWDETEFVNQLRKTIEQLDQSEGLSFSLGVGNLFNSILDIRLSFEEAGKALSYGYQSGKKQFVQTFQSSDVSYLFRMLPAEELAHFYDDTFKAFSDLNTTEREELLKTLHVYYRNHCHLLDTAKELFVHRNTVIYRLDKCEKISGVNLKDALESLRFQLAFAIEPLL